MGLRVVRALLRAIARVDVVAKACSTSMPEFVARDSYVKECSAAGASNDYCACGFAQVKKLASTGEIEAGLFDKRAAQTKVEAACKKFKTGKDAASPRPAGR